VLEISGLCEKFVWGVSGQHFMINTIHHEATEPYTHLIKPPIGYGDDDQETTLNPHFTSVAWKYFKTVTIPGAEE
jgi:hypothetical protein